MTLPLVLGIETSCDETGVGLVRGHDLLADAVASSVDQHQGQGHQASAFRMTTASTPDGW